MKYVISSILYLILPIIITLIPFKSQAFELKLNPMVCVLASSNLDPSQGALVEIGTKWKAVLSYEKALLRFVGQEACDVELYGFMAMRRIRIRDLRMDIGGGYFYPSIQKRAAFREAMMLEINRIYPEGNHSWHNDDTYGYELHGNVGGLFRLAYEKTITKHLSFSFGAGYRFLKLQENLIRDHRNYASNSWVEFMRWQDMSGYFISAGVSVRF